MNTWKKPIQKGLLMVLFVSLFFPAYTKAQSAFTLVQAQEYALKNAQSVKNARYDAEVAELTSDELLAIGLPQINASLQYQNFITLPTQVVDGSFFGAPGQELRLQFGTPQNMTATLSASQLLFDGSWLVGLQASRAYAQLQKRNLSKSELEIKADVAKAYHTALIVDERLEFTRQTRAVIAQMTDETKAYFESGFLEEQDFEQLQLSLSQLDNFITSLEGASKLTKDLLKFTIGMPLNEELTLADKADGLIASEDLLSTGFSSDKTVDVQLAISGLTMQELNLKNKKAAFLPNAALFYSLQSQAFRQEFNFLDTSLPWFAPQLWGFQINVPILSGGGKVKSVQKAQVEVQRMKDTVELTKRATELEYNSAKTEYLTALNSYNQAIKSLELAQKILYKTGIKFKEGVASSMDVSQSTNQVLQAQQDLAQSKENLMNAQVKLKKALNTL